MAVLLEVAAKVVLVLMVSGNWDRKWVAAGMVVAVVALAQVALVAKLLPGGGPGAA